VTASFHVVETELLGSLVGQLLELVRDEVEQPRPGDDPLAAELQGFGAEKARPADPVVLRLFPDAYRSDDDAAAEFRRFTERSLRETKAGTAATVLASLATADQARPGDDDAGDVDEKVKVRLNAEEASAWLRTLTDLRLALGTRLGVEEGDQEHWATLPADDPRRQVHDVYDWLGWVQETLVRAVAP
jgi:hypothetical protein